MYYIVYGFLWLISLLPMRVLYVISDGIYGLVFYILKYRRKVVMDNLLIAFPEKTEKERKQIAKKFYHNLLDTFIETIKMITASQKFILKRFKGDWEAINAVKSTGRSIQVHLGHNFNWEWGNAAAATYFTMPFVGVYMPIGNKVFERLFYTLRTKTGTKLVRATHMREDFLQYRHTQYILGLAADQTPGHPHGGWWYQFFGRPTPFVKGPGKNAVINNTIVFFAFIHKPKRGYYEVAFSEPLMDVQAMDEKKLTGIFVCFLEEVIRRYPDMWLWSHRRWKHEWKPEYGEVMNPGD